MSLSPEYFDALYRESPDPWSLATRSYEARKYAITLAALPLPRYRRAFEPGCSIGALTALLAERTDELVAWDVASAAVDSARRRCPAPKVQFATGSVPGDWPVGSFDLIVFSELGYYFDMAALDNFINRAVASLEDGGHLVAVHWRHSVAEYPGTAAGVHRRLNERGDLLPLAHYQDRHFVLDVFGADGQAVIPGPDD